MDPQNDLKNGEVLRSKENIHVSPKIYKKMQTCLKWF